MPQGFSVAATLQSHTFLNIHIHCKLGETMAKSKKGEEEKKKKYYYYKGKEKKAKEVTEEKC